MSRCGSKFDHCPRGLSGRRWRGCQRALLLQSKVILQLVASELILLALAVGCLMLVEVGLASTIMGLPHSRSERSGRHVPEGSLSSLTRQCAASLRYERKTDRAVRHGVQGDRNGLVQSVIYQLLWCLPVRGRDEP